MRRRCAAVPSFCFAHVNILLDPRRLGQELPAYITRPAASRLARVHCFVCAVSTRAFATAGHRGADAALLGAHPLAHRGRSAGSGGTPSCTRA